MVLAVCLMVYSLGGLAKVIRHDLDFLTEELKWVQVDKKPWFNPGDLTGSKMSFNMAFGFLKERMDPSIGSWEMVYVLQNHLKKKTKTPMSSSYCNETDEKNENQTYFDKMRK